MKNKVLLVGSGGSLIDSKLGSKIDNFEGLICRFNLFSVEGFENDVDNGSVFLNGGFLWS